MQKALRKQRDVELVRVKKDDEEEFALRNRKSSILDKGSRPALDGSQPAKGDKGSTLDPSTLDMLASKDFLLDPRNSAILEAAKENEHIVRRIRARLDKIRHDVNAGRVSPADARVKLDQANSEMAEAERKNNEFRQMILDAEPALSHLQQPNPASLSNVLSKTLASSNADAFSQALTVMKGFFSASDPHDVQTAITDLRSVLELNGPMSPVLQKSFQALEEMLAKPNAKGLTVDVTTADGKTRTCNNVVEVMMNLRLKMQGKDSRSTIADADLNLDEDTMKANHECVKVEEVAKKDMEKMVEKMANDADENLMAALMIIKTRAILKSPIPPLSDIVLDDAISDFMFKRSVKALILDASKGASLLELSGKLTKLVIETARKKPEKYILTLDLVKENILTTSAPPQTLLDALSKVEIQMSKFVALQEEKKKKQTAAQAGAFNLPLASLPPTQDGTSHEKDRWGMSPEEGLSRLQRSFERRLVDPVLFRDSMALHYQMFLDMGPWEMFRIFAKYHLEPRFAFEPWDWEMKFYKANMGLLFPPTQQCLEMIVDYQSRGICPGQTALVIAQRLTYQVRTDFEAAKTNLKIIKRILSHHGSGSNRDWFHTFNFIGQAMIDLFGSLVVEISAWEKNDAPVMAMDIVAMFCTFSLGASGQMQGYSNLKVLEAFIASVLVDYNNGKNLGRLNDVLGRFYHICNDPRHLCSFRHTCRSQVLEENKEKFKAIFPIPPEVEESRKIQMDALSWPPSMFRARERRMAEPPVLPGHVPTKAREPVTDPVAVHYLLNALNTLDDIDGLDPQCYTINTQGSQLQLAVQEYKSKLHQDLDLYYEGKGAERQKLMFEISSTTNELKAIYMVLTNKAHAKDIVTKSRFSEHLDDNSTQESALGPQGISLKHVSRKSPSMVKSWLDITSVSGNVQKDVTEDPTAPLRDGRNRSSSASEASSIKPVLPNLAISRSFSTLPASIATTTHHTPTPTVHPKSTTKTVPNMSEPEPQLSPPEEKIKQQLTTFLNGVLNIGSDAKEMPDSVHKDVFQGVAKHLQNMARGHIEMAWIIAEGRDYTGLQAWLKKRFSSRPKTGEDDGDNDNKVANTTNNAITNDGQIGATSTENNEQVAAQGGAAQNSGETVAGGKATRGPGGRRRKRAARKGQH